MTELKIEDVKSAVATGLESKADATVVAALTAKNAEQEAEIKTLNTAVADIKELAANLEAKQAELILDTKQAEAVFDVKSASMQLKTAIQDAVSNGRPLDLKQMQTGADGVALGIDAELGRTIIERARENVAILGLITAKTVGSVEYREMVLANFPATGAVGEQTGNPADVWAQTGTQKYVGVSMQVAKQYAKPQISRESINDPHIDLFAHLQSLLAEEVSRYWAVQVLFGEGNGSNNQLRGILSTKRFGAESFKATMHATTPRGVEFYAAMKTGIADSIGDRNPTAANSAIDTVIDLTAMLPSKYLGASKFVMNRFTLAEYRKLKDLEGRPLIQFEAGGFNLSGFPIVLEDYMQNEDGTRKAPVIFGDLSKAYALCSIDDFFLVDPYTADGAITLKYEARKGDLMQANDAIVILNTAI